MTKSLSKYVLHKIVSPAIRRLLFIFLTVISVSTFFTFVFKAPEIHTEFIRRTVGDYTYLLTHAEGGGGTGFSMIAPSGRAYIVTNDHICASDKNGFLFAKNTQQTVFKLKITARSTKTDLCVLQIPEWLGGLRFAETVGMGSQVRAVGHPNLYPLTVSNVGEIIGIASHYFSERADILAPVNHEPKCDTTNPRYKLRERNGRLYCDSYIPYGFYTNLLIQPGNSGSPVVDFMGNVVGIVTGIDRYHWGIVIPANEIMEFLVDK